MIKARILILTLVAAMSVSLTAAHASNGSISGKLIDDDNGGAGAAGVEVDVCGVQTPSGCVNGPTTGSDGSFTISGVPPGQNLNVITNPTPGSFPAQCGSGRYARAHTYGVNVGDGQSVSGVNLHLTKATASITGKVFDPRGGALGGATLVADNQQTGGFGYSNTNSAADGSFTLSCLAAVSANYFITTFPANTFGQQVDAEIPVSKNQATNHDIHLWSGPTGQVSGRVLCGNNPCGVPVPVIIRCSDGCPSAGNPNTSSSDGTFVSQALLAGHGYDLHVAAPTGYNNAIIYNQAVNTGATTNAGSVSVIKSGQATSSRISGVIRDANGQPFVDCKINIFGISPAPTLNSFVESLPTDATGKYDSDWILNPASYRVFVDCPGQAEVPAAGTAPFTSPLDLNSLNAGQATTANYNFNGNNPAPGPAPAPSGPSEPQRPWTGATDAIGVSSGSKDVYFAEGYTGLSSSAGFHEYITVSNPGAAQTLTVTYLLKGASPLTKTYNLAAQSRTTINVNDDVGNNKEVSAHLSAPSPIIAERPMYFSNNGIPGAHDVMGAQSLGTNFYFAEGFTGAGFSEFLTLMNSGATDAQVNVTYFFSGQGSKVVPHTIPANSRATVSVNDPAEAGPNQNVSMQVQSTNGVAFLAERPIYFNYPGGFTGGHVVVGAQSLSQHLNLAEGYASKGSFNEYLTVLNPGATAANVTITYYLKSGAPVTKLIQVPAGSRFTEAVNNDLPDGSENSIHLDSDQPIVAERPMYMKFSGRPGGHDAMAADDSALGKTFNFAEGFVSANFSQFFTIMNRSASTANVTVTYLLSSGSPVTKTYQVAAGSRFTVNVNNDLPDSSANSAQISSDQPILVERPMYDSF